MLDGFCQPMVAFQFRSCGSPPEEEKPSAYPVPAAVLRSGGFWRRPGGGSVAMTSKIECPRCGGDSGSLVHGVCRACYMRDHHQRRSAEAVTECPKCGGVSANFVHGVCRACYMRDYHQRRSAAAVTDGGSSHVTDAQSPPVTDAQSPPVTDAQSPPVTDAQSPPVTDAQSPPVTGGRNAPARGTQRVSETPTTRSHDSAGRRVCVECAEPGTYARGLCLSCYMRDRRRRTLTGNDSSAGPRLCVECAEPGVYARGLCQNCYMRERRRHHRIKLRACAVCGVSFESSRRDALYCSSGCRQKAHRSGKTQAA